MRMNPQVASTLTLMLTLALPAQATAAAEPVNNPVTEPVAGSETSPARYVNVTVEIQGLDESVVLLKDAAGSLAETMEALKERKGELSSEDLARIERIASSMEAVTARIDHTLDNAGNNIEKARAPTVSLVSDIVKETKVEAIDPVIVSVQETVAASISQVKWGLIYVGILLLVGLSVFGFFMFKSLMQIRDITASARDAFSRGEFTFRLRDQAPPALEAEPADPSGPVDKPNPSE